MLPPFFRYFSSYLFKARTRQRLLFLAVLGLVISSFALIVLQSTMGGLQNSLMTRHKEIAGSAVLFPEKTDEESVSSLVDYLNGLELKAIGEQELEVLLKSGAYLTPVIIHGIEKKQDLLPKFLKDKGLTEIVLPLDLAIKLDVQKGELIRLISPAHVDSFMGDIPRMSSLYIDRLITTDVPEIDGYHAWVSLKKVQNLIRARSMNRVRLYENDIPDDLVGRIQNELGQTVQMKTWEQVNDTLVWALSLETSVMIFLFISMTLLVSLCITSGLLIFFSKIKTDLSSFWILGSSKDNLDRSAGIFLQMLGLISVITGLLLGVLFLFVLDRYALEIMPDVFVDRKIPVHYTVKGFLISFIVPYAISSIFGQLSLSVFKKETNYLEQVRSVGS